MYLGSVRFYKHLIYLVLLALIFLIGLGLYKLCSSITMANHDLKYALAQNAVGTEEAGKIEPIESEGMEGQVDDSMSISDILESDYSPLITYQSLNPDLYTELPLLKEREGKIAYLTFDDGPSARTLEILDILKEENVKATFFVVTENSDLELLERIQREGHTIGVHSNSHRYLQIYSSVDDFLDDFYQAYTKIYDATSVYPQIFRFPGGSINAHNLGIYQELVSEMLRRGFLYYDWNISSQDAVSKVSAGEIINNVTRNIRGQKQLVILLHDSRDKTETVKALPGIIKFLKEENYTLAPIDNSVKPIIFSYK
jgi:peptidoglycan/xylan/chitin deacetylase (PgdA/CDA1 family)